jgi:hypothetical protein
VHVKPSGSNPSASKARRSTLGRETRAETSVHDHRRPRHEGSVVTGKKDCQAASLLRFPDPPQSVEFSRRQPRRRRVGLGLKVAPRQARVDVPWTNAVNANAFLTVVDGQRFGQGNDPPLVAQ